jgi:orotate phosphoribosyltransferase-like protein
MENYALHPGVSAALKRTVVLFDDVITAGNHYVACKRFVERHCGPQKICGVFIARRVIRNG